MGHDTDDARSRAMRELEEAATLPDINAEPGPEDPDFFSTEATPEAAAVGLESVKWPSNDRNAPDYSYIADEPNPARFTLTGESVETMLRLGRFAPDRSNGVIALAIRGAALTSGNEVEGADEIDNVHCSYFLAENSELGATFSSWGCLTVRGGEDPWPAMEEVPGDAEGGRRQEARGSPPCDRQGNGAYRSRAG